MIYVVTGIMRSGTSMMMQALEAGGLEAAYIPRGGCYELATEDLYAPDFPHQFEGKLIKALDFVVLNMCTMPSGIRIVAMRRQLAEMQQSMRAFLGERDAELQEAVKGFDNKLVQLQQRKDVLSLDVFWYRDVLERPLEHFELLRSHGWEIDAKRCATIPNLKHKDEVI